MPDRKVMEEFVLKEIENTNIDVPQRINKKALAKAFCQFVEEDYCEWLRDNFNSFFRHGNPDWNWIEKYVQERIGRSP
jgi:hypothetical protein